MKVKVKPRSIFPTTEQKPQFVPSKKEEPKISFDPTTIPVQKQKPKQSFISRCVDIIVEDFMSFLNRNKKVKEQERINKMKYDAFMEMMNK